MKLLFIHRSVGHHLIQRGHLREQLTQFEIELDDYDNNLGLLTFNNGHSEAGALSVPGNNTNPDNLALLFASWPKLFGEYDAFMIKSCYPNSHIKSQAQLKDIKQHYQTIIEAARSHKKTLIILTTPPLRPMFTTKTETKFADELANWLITQSGPGVKVFNYRKLLSNSRGVLKANYRYWLLPWDNHPTASADHDIAPKLVQYLEAELSHH